MSYPSIFPAVEATPPPRADTPMDANQVQQATEDLISDRNRLSAEAQGSGAQSGGSAPAAKKPSATQPSGYSPDAGGYSTQSAGAETK